MLSLVLLALSFWDSLLPSRTLRLPSGGEISTFGRGPPCMFSSGLFGLMPRRLYTDLFSELMPHVTLVVLNDLSPVTRDTVEEVAETLAVETIAFLSHSAFDGSVLSSPVLHGAVLCDPVILPSPTLPFARAPLPIVQPLVLRAGRAYEGSGGMPDFLFPEVGSTTVTYDDMGHADVLDDRWASLGPAVIPWMKGPARERTDFRSWAVQNQTSLVDSRRTYRSQLARRAVDHLLGQDEGDSGLIVV